MGLFFPAAGLLYAFRVSHFEDAILLVMLYFVVAGAIGQLTTRIRAQEAAERQREARATALYLLGRELAEAATIGQMAERVVAALGRTFDAKAALLLTGNRLRLQLHEASTLPLTDKEAGVAAWGSAREPATSREIHLSSADGGNVVCSP